MNWRYLFGRAKWDRERFDEMESYVQIETDENIARGMPAAEAHAAARRKFGNTTTVREEIYRMNTVIFLDTLVRDMRYGLRALAKNPTFTAVALLTLAIGIGANTAVFSVLNCVLLKPLNYPHAEQLVALRQMAPGAAGLASFSEGLPLSASMYFTYSEHNRTFQSLGVWSPSSASVTGLAEPEQVRVVAVSDGVLQALAVPPALGRWLSAADQVPQGRVPGSFAGRSTTVMLSYGYWQRRFGGDRAVIGRNITVDAEARQIVGVMPQSFRVVNTDFDIMSPMAFERDGLPLAGFGLQGIARLKPGVAITQGNADLTRLLPVWMDSWSNGPGTGNGHFYENWRITPAIRPLKQEVVGSVSDVLWVVMATIGLVMLIACANVTNLLLVRAEVRRQELALRSALGAGTGRIIGALLAESVMLGLLGGILGIVVAEAGLKLLVVVGPANLPRLSEIALDAKALAFTLVLSVLSGLFFGLIPALKYAGPRISTALRSAGRGASLSRERHRTRNLLVVAQVAMALVLMVAAGLMIRTFQALRNVQPGFTDPQHLQTIRLAIPRELVADAVRVTHTQNEIADKLAAIPGVTAVGFAGGLPMEGYGSGWDNVFAEDKPDNGGVAPMRLYEYVSPGYFQTAGTRLVTGRELTWIDVYGQRPVVMVSANLAREMWGSPSAALGKRLREYPGMPWKEVIGVIEDVHLNGVEKKPPETVYWPTLMADLYGPSPLDAIRSVTVAIRSDRTGTEGFLNQVRLAVWSVNASLPVASTRTMQEIYDESMARTSFTLVMLGIAGAMALLLGIIGIYGVMAYAVSQRRREIGIRLALGAPQGELKRMFLRYALGLTGIGVVIGLAAAAGLTRLMSTLLFGIAAMDPLTYISVPLVLLAAALLASYLPARRAAAVDPVETLKAE